MDEPSILQMYLSIYICNIHVFVSFKFIYQKKKKMVSVHLAIKYDTLRARCCETASRCGHSHTITTIWLRHFLRNIYIRSAIGSNRK